MPSEQLMVMNLRPTAAMQTSRALRPCHSADKSSANAAQRKHSIREEIDKYLMMPKSAFDLPFNPQKQSKFLLCPSEIRCRVMYMLLHEDEPLTHPQLSSQLLSTCQILYNEGTPILYGSNTLQINFPRSSCQNWVFAISTLNMEAGIFVYEWQENVVRSMNRQVHGDGDIFPRRCWDPPPMLAEFNQRLDRLLAWKSNDLDLDEDFQNERSLIADPDQLMTDAVIFLKRYRAMQRFDRIILQFPQLHAAQYPANKYLIFTCTRRLACLLVGKNVTIDIGQSWSDRPLYIYSSLRALRYLRCRSIEIVVNPAQRREDDKIKSFCASIKKLVESDTPVIDTWKMRVDLEDRIYELFKECDKQFGTNLFERVNQVSLQMLIGTEVAVEYDVSRYLECSTPCIDRLLANVIGVARSAYTPEQAAKVEKKLRVDFVGLKRQQVVEVRHSPD